MAKRQRGSKKGQQNNDDEEARRRKVAEQEASVNELDEVLRRARAAKRKANAEAKQKAAEAIAQQKADDDAEIEVRMKAEAEAKRKDEAEAARKASQMRKEKEAAEKAEKDKADAEAKRQAESEAKKKAKKEAEEAKAKREVEKAEAERKAKAKMEAEAKAKRDAEEASKLRKEKEAEQRKAAEQQAEKDKQVAEDPERTVTDRQKNAIVKSAKRKAKKKQVEVDQDRTESDRKARSASGDRLQEVLENAMEEDVEVSNIVAPSEDNLKRANGNVKLAKKFDEHDAKVKAIADALHPSYFQSSDGIPPVENPKKEKRKAAKRKVKNSDQDKQVMDPKNNARKPRPGSKISQFRKNKAAAVPNVHVQRNDGQFHRNVQNNQSYLERKVKLGLLFKPTAFHLMVKKIIHSLQKSTPHFDHINHIESTVTPAVQTMAENYLSEFLDDTMKVSKHCRPTTRDKTWILLKKDIEHLYRFRNNGDPFSHYEADAEKDAREQRVLQRH